MATDIIIGQKPATKIKRRCRTITVHNPTELTQKSIDFQQENVELLADGTPTGAVESAPQFSELITTLLPKVYQIDDPITGTTVAVSGAAVALWLEMFYVERATALG